MTNLAIVSDIRLYREGLGRILNEIDGICVIDVIDSHKKILKLLETKYLDVILLDMRMPDNCLIISSLTKKFFKIKIIVIAVPDVDESYLLCAESGIAGYLSKESTIEDLVDAIKAVGQGDLYCPCNITQYILNSVKHRREGNKINAVKLNDSNILGSLTQREEQIVKLVADGMSNKKIANTLNIELSTVKNHVHNILVKLGIDSRSQIASMLQKKLFSQKNRSIDLDNHLDLP